MNVRQRKLLEQPIEVVTDMIACPEATAHRRRGAGSAALLAWPTCTPKHQHLCENDRLDQCMDDCRCICRCVLPKFYEYSALRARTYGVQLCDSPHCFGGI